MASQPYKQHAAEKTAEIYPPYTNSETVTDAGVRTGEWLFEGDGGDAPETLRAAAEAAV